ncbi:MAG: hypothetical protein JWL69_4202 [Phycisphaerales bacterium]|jgi:hypothetical protein|nr:hypothetical protein [Phycisphaerales bacterium]
MGKRPCTIDYASPQKSEPPKEWPAWLVAVTAAVVTLSIMAAVFLLIMTMIFSGFRGPG